MSKQLLSLWADEAGAVISAELLLIATLLVLGLIVGLSRLQGALTSELNDLAGAATALNQSFGFTGSASRGTRGTAAASFVSGSVYYDVLDAGDPCLVEDLVGGGAWISFGMR